MEKEFIDNIYNLITYMPDDSCEKLDIKALMDLLNKLYKITDKSILKLLSSKPEQNVINCKDFQMQLEKLTK